MYTRYSFFVGPHQKPTSPEDKHFDKIQKGARKEVERLYAALFQK